MAGKAYTMREMKTIVEYLIEHKAYGETKGRKMWKDFANSKLTNRTWQSLKETFLKRILPDIHNPYYKLTMEQIASLRQGFDIGARINNKLQIRSLSEDSNSTTDGKKDVEKPSTSKGQEENPGEDITYSKVSSHHRSSVETLILDNENSEAEKDINNGDNVSTNEEPQVIEEDVPTLQNESYKSVRDLITYTDPLTPMLQEVLHDFSSDDEEPQMQICEDLIPSDHEKENNTNNHGVTVASLSVLNDQTNGNQIEAEKEIVKDCEIKTACATEQIDSHVSPHIEKSTNNDHSNDKDGEVVEINPPLQAESKDDEVVEIPKSPKTISKINDETPIPSGESESLPVSNITVDTQLPNNQEQLPNVDEIKKNKKEKSLDKETNSKDRKDPNHKVLAKKSKSKKQQQAKGIETIEIIDHSEESLKPDENREEIDNGNKAVDVEANNNVANNLTYDIVNSEDITASQKSNPCLQSVSLYDEQFSLAKLSESESSVKQVEVAKSPPKKKKEYEIVKKVNDTIILKSHSESELEQSEPIIQTHPKPKKDRVLAKIFGFAGGNIATSKKMKKSRNKSSSRHKYTHHLTSGSSEWTSESDSEYVAPPRSRKHKQGKKILKPNSARILSLEEEGGLFVVHGKKIFPLMKDGKILQTYLTYLPESDSEEEKNNYWKTKYVKEKLKASELAKMLEKDKADSSQNKCSSPILQGPFSKTNRLTLNKNKLTEANNDTKEIVPVGIDKNEERSEKTVRIKFTKNNEELQLEGNWQNLHPVLEQVVRIFHKDSGNVDAQKVLEANKNEQEKGGEGKKQVTMAEIEKARDPKMKTDEDERITILSGQDTPINDIPIPDVHEKVTQLENEIFSEIEELEKKHNESEEHVETEKNVTTRKKRSLTLKTESPAKRRKLRSKSGRASSSDKQDNSNQSTGTSSPGKKSTLSPKKINFAKKLRNLKNVISPKRKSSSPKKLSPEMPAETASPKGTASIEKPKRGRPRLDQTQNSPTKSGKPILNSPPKVTAKQGRPRSVQGKTSPVKEKQVMSPKKSPQNKKRQITKTDKGKQIIGAKSPPLTPKKKISKKIPEVATRKSIRSAPARSSSRSKVLLLKRNEIVAGDKDLKVKRKSSIMINKANKSDGSSSSNLSMQSESTQGYQDSDGVTIGLRRRKKKRISVSTVSYKGRNKYHNTRRFSKTNGDDASSESSNLSCYLTANTGHNSSNTEAYKTDSYQLLFPKNKSAFGILEKIDEIRPNQGDKKTDIQYSLSQSSDNVHINVALPNSSHENSSNILLSPEISIVEKLSLSKSGMSNVEYPTGSETQNANLSNKALNKFLMTDVDVTMPLMGQDCELQKKISQFRKLQEPNLLSTVKTMESLPKRSLMSESLLNQICKVNIEESQSSSDSLDRKLRDLLLESAKKMSHQNRLEENFINENDPRETKLPKKVSKKRSSTPIKRNTTKKTKNIDAIIEERMESCSYGGRRSCPPSIQIIGNDNTNSIFDQSDTVEKTPNSSVVRKGNEKKKKDVIKVKILRPKRTSKDKSKNDTPQINKLNELTENESGIFLKAFNDSVDLIHNHSETCLQAHNCVGDSLEIFDKSTGSIVTLDSVCNSMEITNLEKSTRSGSSRIESSNELLCDNARDSYNFSKATTPSPMVENFDTGFNIVTHNSAGSFNSLMTEDLSNEPIVEPASRPRSWHFLSEDETTNANLCPIDRPIAAASDVAKDGANLKQIFPLTCAVPDLSTITEQDENSRKTRTDTNCDNGTDIISQSLLNSNSAVILL